MTAIELEYRRLTPRSARWMERAADSMPRGLTRTLSWFAPYPVVFDHGRGAAVYDVDGNRYLDLFSNGLSLMHGHAYGPIEDALRVALSRGTAWPGTSDAQVQFAELLCQRLPGAERVRFANTGTEATMLAVKLARHVTQRPLIIKAWHAYHGSYDDLEVGLQGQGELPGRAALARFGELDTYAEALERHAGEVAAIIVEPVQYTGVVTPPPDGFLPALRELAREAGVLFVLDDCLMFRLAEGGSAERFGIDADITCLGKWIGGGLPVGVVASSEEIMSAFDLAPERPLYHGGSFNGNLLGMVAGAIAVRDLTSRGHRAHRRPGGHAARRDRRGGRELRRARAHQRRRLGVRPVRARRRGWGDRLEGDLAAAPGRGQPRRLLRGRRRVRPVHGAHRPRHRAGPGFDSQRALRCGGGGAQSCLSAATA